MKFVRAAGVMFVLAILPAAAFAQGTSGIAGVVRDTSGAVIPGVTVEASSPALIEKVRTVVTDGEGLYKFVDLRPGVYTVTFTLSGFNTIKRDGIELSAGFTASVNADMRVGALEETITVVGRVADGRHDEHHPAESHLPRAARLGAEQPDQLRGVHAGRVPRRTSAAAAARTPALRSRSTARAVATAARD